MCGLVGYFSFSNDVPNENYFQWCINTMKHRGPDDSGLWSNGRNYLAAFVRLSVRDISTHGHQPMFSVDRNYCITFNGEIYNTSEIKHSLNDFSIEWQSSSDTEVLLYAIIHHGIQKALEMIDGMFAFAYFDVKNDALILARDRMGIKPLYIGQNKNGVVYSSQYDHIINHPFFKNNSIDSNALGQYLQLGYVPVGLGMLEETWLVPQGHYYTIHKQSIQAYQYYEFAKESVVHKDSSLENTLSTAVQAQLVSDVPVGCFLSGGVDSSLITLLAAKSNSSLHSFTIGNQESNFDESAKAAAVANMAKLKHHISFLGLDNASSLIQQHVAAFSEPFADHSSLPLLHLASFTKQKATVALSGDGADELFWGYQRSLKLLKSSKLYSHSHFLRKPLASMNKIYHGKKRIGAGYWNQDNFDMLYYQRLYNIGAYELVPELFLGKLSWPKSISTLSKELDSNTNIHVLMNHARIIELQFHLQRILLKTDRATMFSGLELRVPFLSNAMLKFAASLSYKDCIHSKNGKYNLKKSLSSIMGSEFAFQKKQGFIIPIEQWMKGPLRKDIIEKLFDLPTALVHFFEVEKLRKHITEYFEGKNNHGNFIWTIYVLVLWYDFHVNIFEH